jgi:hypothetical protein
VIPAPAILRSSLRLARPRMAVAPKWPRAFRALVALLVTLVAIHVGVSSWLDRSPQARDPEYGKRLARLRARTAEHPGRPLVLVLGNSRTAMGVRPGVLEPAPGRPLVFNFALAGSGPIMELMAFRRAVADGVRPAAVLVEYWPPVMCEHGRYHEAARFDPCRLRGVDADTVREFFPDPAGTERVVRGLWFNPVSGRRRSLLNQLDPRWLPAADRSDSLWAIDDWGWLPGRASMSAEEAEAVRGRMASYYGPLFAEFEVSPVADAAVRRLVGECRAIGVPVALVYLPESPAFLPPAVAVAADGYLARLRAELSLPLIDARDWSADLSDGFHLTPAGAAAFTTKLAPALDAAFPELAR